MTHPLKDLEPVAPFDMARRPFRRCPPKGLVVRAPNEQRRDTDGRQREQGTWRAARRAIPVERAAQCARLSHVVDVMLGRRGVQPGSFESLRGRSRPPAANITVSGTTGTCQARAYADLSGCQLRDIDSTNARGCGVDSTVRLRNRSG